MAISELKSKLSQRVQAIPKWPINTGAVGRRQPDGFIGHGTLKIGKFRLHWCLWKGD